MRIADSEVRDVKDTPIHHQTRQKDTEFGASGGQFDTDCAVYRIARFNNTTQNDCSTR